MRRIARGSGAGRALPDRLTRPPRHTAWASRNHAASPSCAASILPAPRPPVPASTVPGTAGRRRVRRPSLRREHPPVSPCYPGFVTSCAECKRRVLFFQDSTWEFRLRAIKLAHRGVSPQKDRVSCPILRVPVFDTDQTEVILESLGSGKVENRRCNAAHQVREVFGPDAIERLDETLGAQILVA